PRGTDNVAACPMVLARPGVVRAARPTVRAPRVADCRFGGYLGRARGFYEATPRPFAYLSPRSPGAAAAIPHRWGASRAAPPAETQKWRSPSDGRDEWVRSASVGEGRAASRPGRRARHPCRAQGGVWGAWWGS